MRRIIATTLTASIAASGAAHADVKPLSEHPEMGELIERWEPLLPIFDTPGIALAVVDDGHTWVYSWGERDRVAGEPVDENTMFYIASVTKTMNAMAICTLAAEGKLSLDDPVVSHLPRFRVADEELTKSVTIRDLLAHKPGINHGPIVLLDAYTGEITDDIYFELLADAEAAGEVSYTNVHYTILGRVIEAVTGMPWQDYLDEAVFTPAGMTRTTAYASKMWNDPNHAMPHERVMNEWKHIEMRKTDRTMHAAGGVATTAVDAARWIELNLNLGTIDGTRVIPERLAKEMQTFQVKFDEEEGSIRVMQGFGLGWQMGEYRGDGSTLCAHGGGYVGAASYFAFLPEQQAGVAVLVNGGGPARAMGDLMVIDVLESVTGAEPAWDVYSRYLFLIAQHLKGSHPGFPALEGGALAAEHLSRPARSYEGRYRHATWGTITLRFEQDGLHLSIGDAPLRLSPTEEDAFLIEGPILDETKGHFEIDGSGRVLAVVLDEEDLGAIRFER